MARSLAVERRNLHYYGFWHQRLHPVGDRNRPEVTDGRLPASVITELLDVGRDMLIPLNYYPMPPGYHRAFAPPYNLVMITKGEGGSGTQLAQSGLRDGLTA
jgi:putative hydrolase of the HAD superfamily